MAELEIGIKFGAGSICKRLLALIVIFCAAIWAMGEGALAVSSDDVTDNFTVEYHYTEGEEDTISIPEVIEEFNREYRLVDVSDPIVEDRLPLVRTYTFRVDGVMTSEELASFSGTESLVLTPVEVVLERNVDRIEVITGLPNNDVEDLPESRVFEVSSASSPSGVELAELIRAGISFEVTGRDEYGLPSSYAATIVYRGVETYMGTGYYLAQIEYTQTEVVGDVPLYVIIAVYEPVEVIPPLDMTRDAPIRDEDIADFAPVASVAELPETEQAEEVAQSVFFNIDETLASLSPDEMIQLRRDVIEELRGSGIPTVMIGSQEVPLFGSGNPFVWSLVNLILSAIGLLLVIITGVRFTAQKLRERKEAGTVYTFLEEGNRERRRVAWLVTAVLLGIAAPVLFLFTQNMGLLMVMLDRWSSVYAVILAVVIVSYLLAFRREGDESYEINDH